MSAEAVAAWQRRDGERAQVLSRATEAMLDLARIGPGARVLDIAAGAGGQTLLAARRAGPTGVVVATDASAAMLDSARQAADRAGLTNVVIRVTDVESLDLEPASFDAAICRNALMLFPDVLKALGVIRQMLKPGGRFAALVFSVLERNPRFSIPRAIISRRGSLPAPRTGEPDDFALGAPRALQGVLERAGFREIEVQAVPLVQRYESIGDLMASQRNVVDLIHLMARLPEREREPAWAEIESAFQDFARPMGVEIPGELLLGGGTN